MGLSLTGVIVGLSGAVACFAMFFGFGPSPENQMTAVWGLVCLASAFVSWSSRPWEYRRERRQPIRRSWFQHHNDWATYYPANPFPLAYACTALFIGVFVAMGVMQWTGIHL